MLKWDIKNLVSYSLLSKKHSCVSILNIFNGISSSELRNLAYEFDITNKFNVAEK